MTSKKVLMISRLVFVGAALWFGVVTLGSRTPEIVSAMSSVSLPAMALALLSVTTGLLATALIWRELLSDIGTRIALPDALSIFFVGQLGKYVPGSVWTLLAHAQLGRRLSIAPRAACSTGVLFLWINMATALGIGSVVVQIVDLGITLPLWVSVGCGVLVAASLTPIFLTSLSRRISRVIQPISGRTVVTIVVLNVTAWILYAGALHVLAGGHGIDNFLGLLGAFALAYVFGVLVVVAPAGLGAREPALIFMLIPVLGVTEAASIGLMARILHTLADFGLAAVPWHRLTARTTEALVKAE